MMIAVTVVAAVGAGLACWGRARDARSRGMRRAWAFLAAGCLAWAAGEAVWGFYDFVLDNDTPFPSVADVGYLAWPPLAVLGLLWFPAARSPGRHPLRALLDACIVACSALFVSWLLVLDTVYESGSGSALAQVLSLAYPIADVALVTVVAIVGVRLRPGPTRRSIALLAAGVTAIAVSDVMFASLAPSDSYGSHILDLGWLTGFVAIGVAAVVARGKNELVGVEVSATPTTFGVLFPYVPCAVALVAALGAAIAGEFDTFLTVNGLVLIALLLARQLVTLLDNVSLTRRLAAGVEARTAQLRDQDARIAALARRASDLVSVVDPDGIVLYQSESIEGILGLSVDRVLGTDFRLLVHPDDRRQWTTAVAEAAAGRGRPVVLEWRVWHADGTWRVLETTVTDMLDDPAVAGIVLNARDVTERNGLEERLRFNAFHDPLTGLANRALFRDRLQHALASSSRSRRTVAVLFVDLDDFKAINDVHGHQGGDRALVEVGRRLRRAVRDADTVARFGGDEFAILLEHADGEREAVGVAHRILEELERPWLAGQRNEVHFRAGVGIATGFGGSNPETLQRNADVAMHAAKANGRHGYEVFRPHMHAVVLERLRMEADLRRALEREEFVVHYQPIIELETGSTVAVEALVRWAPGGGSLVPPSDFIPVAEATGLIVPIGAWVLSRALRDVAGWRAPDGRLLELNVNLSVRQLDDDDFVETVRRTLAETSFDPARLTLEITESLLLESADGVDARLAALKEMGVKLAIDDFGTGYSSLAYLQRLPVDELKIDRSFVVALREQDAEIGVVRTILSLAQHFHLRAVAEGVEEATELDALVALGCTRVQGFLFARPMSAADFETRLLGAPHGSTTS